MVEQGCKLEYKARCEPKDWQLQKISDIIISTELGGNYPNSEEETPFPLIKMGNIGRGSIALSKVEYIKQNIAPAKKDLLQYGDVLFNTRNTLELVGKVAIWKNELNEAYFNSNLMRIKFRPDIDNFFMNYLFNYRTLLLQLKSIATGTTSVGAIYTRDLLGLQVTIPQQPEQFAIAKTLLNIDSLIISFDRLIVKKKYIKQGVMQELFRNSIHKRGFKESPIGKIPKDWNIQKLGNLIDEGLITYHLDGNHGELYPRAEEFVEEGVPFLSANMIIDGKIDFTKSKYLSEKRAKQFTKGIAENGDILLTHNATVGPVTILETELPYVILGTSLTSFRCNLEKISNKFLRYYMESNYFQRQLESSMKQTTRNQVPITAQKKFFFIIPPKIEEQTTIGQILTDIEGEIETLNRERVKCKLLKVGLMQQLLTGRIRLKCQS